MVGSSAVAVLAVDGGNSKTDLLVIDRRGQLLARHRGPTISHQQVGLVAGVERLTAMVGEVSRAAGIESLPAMVGAFALAGADTPADTGRLRAALAATGLAAETLVINDAFAPVWAGSDGGWGVGIICGAGVNAAGIAPDGRTARLAALGPISGDWGGGNDVGMAGLGAAVRARDGRGPSTLLETLVPAHFGYRRPIDVTQAIEHDRLAERRVGELSPVVFGAAAAGDPVARGIVDRLADELATMAGAIIRRLRLTRLDVPVTLAGGVFLADDAEFVARIRSRILDVAPAARVERLLAPPVLGAALLGFEHLMVAGAVTAADHETATRSLRRALTSGGHRPG